LAVLHAITSKDPVPLSRLNPKAGGEPERVVHKALVKEPDERYQSMEKMLADLKGWHQNVQQTN